jgi:hypothetical protein
MRRIILFTKPGCHLCDEALDMLLTINDQTREELTIEEINILDDPELYAQYRHVIPVISIDPDANGPLLQAPISEKGLYRALIGQLD